MPERQLFHQAAIYIALLSERHQRRTLAYPLGGKISEVYSITIAGVDIISPTKAKNIAADKGVEMKDTITATINAGLTYFSVPR